MPRLKVIIEIIDFTPLHLVGIYTFLSRIIYKGIINIKYKQIFDSYLCSPTDVKCNIYLLNSPLKGGFQRKKIIFQSSGTKAVFFFLNHRCSHRPMTIHFRQEGPISELALKTGCLSSQYYPYPETKISLNC